MSTTKEGSPINNSETPNNYVEKRPLATFDLSIHPLDAYLKKTPQELQAEAKKLQKFADVLRNHWTFVLFGVGLGVYNYYKNYDTMKTLTEIKDYVRSKKK